MNDKATLLRLIHELREAKNSMQMDDAEQRIIALFDIVRDEQTARAEAAEKRIAELEAAQRWVPAGERLPKEGQLVEVTSFTNDVFSWYYSVSLKDDFVRFNTHWRPLELPHD